MNTIALNKKKIKSSLVWLSAILAPLPLGGVGGGLLTACSPDDHSLSQPDLTTADLAQGIAYSVTVDADNTVTLKSLLDKSYNCYWTQPNGRSQGPEVKFQLPFAGTYEVRFGVDTRGGVVYGEPYQFLVTTNNMSLLEDPLYAYLSGGVGKQKKWVPVDKFYGVGQCTAPVMYCNPDDVLNDGSGDTNIGIGHMVPNWDPGFQSWLIPADSPYMNSYMIFSLDDQNGCSIEEYRGDDGTTKKGKWNLNLTDKNHPTLSFTDAYAMHNQGFDEVCNNYTTDIVITELTPYMLQLATMRTNSEGAWWLIWNFIAADVQSGAVEIPSDEPSYIEPAAPAAPQVADLATKLFTTDINGVNFQGDQMTFLPSDEGPYDWQWWNGGTQAWESVAGGNYSQSWTPAWTDDVLDLELTFARKADGTYTYEIGEQSGTMTIGDGTLLFDKEVSLFTVAGGGRTLELKGQEWTVFKCDPGSELVIGVPDQQDADGNVNTYLVANLVYKAVGGGQSGPIVVPFTADNVNNYIEADKYFRCQLYNPWGGGGDAIDPTTLKVKKNQTLKVTLRLNGFTFEQPAKMVLCLNWETTAESGWEPDCFGYQRAIEVNGDGTYTVSWTNDTGGTVNWGDATSALIITMQYVGYASVEPDAEGTYKAACTVESITVE